MTEAISQSFQAIAEVISTQEIFTHAKMERINAWVV
jgi:hypothetical protein